MSLKELKQRLEGDKVNFSAAMDKACDEYLQDATVLKSLLSKQLFDIIDRRTWQYRNKGHFNWKPSDELAVILKEALLGIRPEQEGGNDGTSTGSVSRDTPNAPRGVDG